MYVLFWNERFMSLHWTHEGLTKERRAFFRVLCQRDEPLGRNQFQFLAHWFVDQHIGLHRVRRALHREIDEVDAHGTLGIFHVASDFLAGVVDAANGRQVQVAYGHLIVLILLQRLAQAVELYLVRVLCRNWLDIRRDEQAEGCNGHETSRFCSLHHVSSSPIPRITRARARGSCYEWVNCTAWHRYSTRRAAKAIEHGD